MLTICRRPISCSVYLRDSTKRFPNETTQVRIKEKREKLRLPRDSGPKMVSLIPRKIRFLNEIAVKHAPTISLIIIINI